LVSPNVNGVDRRAVSGKESNGLALLLKAKLTWRSMPFVLFCSGSLSAQTSRKPPGGMV